MLDWGKIGPVELGGQGEICPPPLYILDEFEANHVSSNDLVLLIPPPLSIFKPSSGSMGKIGLAGEKIMPNSLAHKKLTNSREIFWLFWLKPSLHQNSRLELKLIPSKFLQY